MRPEITREPVAFEKFIAKWMFRISIAVAIPALPYVTMSIRAEERKCEQTCKDRNCAYYFYKQASRYVKGSSECYCLKEAFSDGAQLSKETRAF